ncbi:MAG TPA: hypothetical protein VHE37_09170 [Nevskiaceae bacterium]|nr:hypothetical protein [Nevskiaceae bacterium]
MANRGQFFSSAQGDFFQRLEEAPPTAADLDIGLELLGAINTAIREAKGRGMSRDRIVERMNDLLPDAPKQITKRQLDAWTAQSKEHHEFPARYLPAFCAATDCELPLRVLAQAIGRELVHARDLAAKRLGENIIERARLKREERDLARQLGHVSPGSPPPGGPSTPRTRRSSGAF